ncbi:MAG: PH domain-containing protein [bacterium]|nr:PH domain-containing protein [bacterium]
MTSSPNQQFTKDGNRILLKAQFDTRLIMYAHLQVLFGFAITIIGLPVAAIWALVGRELHQRQYDALQCELTERTLNYRKGVFFRVQKSVPLDKITDLALNEGPILRHFGLCSLTVETAGGGSATATGQAVLVGMVDSIEFRNAVMRQRDLVVGGAAAPARVATAPGPSDVSVLEEIRDSLGRIETLLANSSSASDPQAPNSEG